LLVDGFLIEEGPDYTHSSLQEIANIAREDSTEKAVKVGLVVFLANDRENYTKRQYDTIRALGC